MRPIPTDSGSSYGSTNQVEPSGSGLRQTFSITEPSYSELTENGARFKSRLPTTSGLSCCRKSGGDSVDGLRVIIISMFVFSVGVTIALIIHIAAESGEPAHESDKVVSGHAACSALGHDVLKQGGNAVDAAVTSTICMALMEPHLTGIGGGGMMIIHRQRSNATTVIDFRETAPANVRNDRFIQNPLLAKIGKQSIAVPGFLAGLEYAHKKYGSGIVGVGCCQWFDLAWKSLHLALKGVPVSKHFLNATETKIDPQVLESDDFKNLRSFIKPNDKTLTEEDIFDTVPMYQKLVNTLEEVARGGASAFYQGDIGKKMVESLGGAISMDDLNSYRVVETEPLKKNIGGFEIITSPAPSSGPELLAFLNAIQAYNSLNSSNVINEKYLDTIARVLKRVHKEQLKLGDPLNDDLVKNRTSEFINQENGPRWLSGKSSQPDSDGLSYELPPAVSSHVAVMDRKDVYVSVVTSLNTWFGSKIMTDNGILMNNALANFEIPEENSLDQKSFISNGMSFMKRPLTTNVVALASDTGNVCGRRILLGGATADSVGQVLSDAIFQKGDLTVAVGNARVLVENDAILLEDAYRGFPQQVIVNFQRSHPDMKFLRLPYTSVNVLEKTLDVVLAMQDIRSKGEDDNSHGYKK